MAGISSKAAGKLENKFKFGSKELQSSEFSDNSGLDLYDFSARNYDPQIGIFRQTDPHSFNYYSWSPYNYCANNPIILTDPTGKDWFEDKKGNVIWNNSRDKTYTQEKVKYKNIGSTLSITTISAIRNPNDIPVSFDVSGNKLQNNYTITGKYDKEGNFSGFESKLVRTTGKTELIPGLALQGAEAVNGTTNSNTSIAPDGKGGWAGGFEQHTEVNPLEKPGLLAVTGNVVDVNVAVGVNIDSKGNLSVGISHGTFPSVTMWTGAPGNELRTQVYEYQQASYMNSHQKTPWNYNPQKAAMMSAYQIGSNAYKQPIINKG